MTRADHRHRQLQRARRPGAVPRQPRRTRRPTTPHEIVVVDNASTDGSADVVRARPGGAAPGPRRERRLRAAPTTRAIRATASELVLLLNSDTVVPAGAIDGLVARAARPTRRPRPSGPRLVDADGRAGAVVRRDGRAARRVAAEAARARPRGRGDAVRPQDEIERRTRTRRWPDWVSGACLLVRRDDAEAAGLLDERYFMYLEDVDFCAALRARGGRILFAPDGDGHPPARPLAPGGAGRDHARLSRQPPRLLRQAPSALGAAACAPTSGCSYPWAGADTHAHGRACGSASMRASSTTSASAPTCRTCCGSWPGWKTMRSTCCSAAPSDVEWLTGAGARTSAPSSTRGGQLLGARADRGAAGGSGATGVDLFHSPHYVLPLLVPCPSVVTIHDCIHLMFPQYLPNRLAIVLRAVLHVVGDAAGSARVLTVSEASKRDILRFCRIPADKVTVIHNAIDDRFRVPPPDDEVRAHPRALPAARAVRPLRRQRQAAQEPRAPDRGHPSPARERLRRAEAARSSAATSRSTQTLRRAIHAHNLHSYVRFLGFVPDQTLAHPLPARLGVRLPVALRGLRPAAARSDGLRRAGRHLEHVVAARGGRRRRRAGRSDGRPRHRGGPGPRPRPTPTCAPTCGAAASSGRSRSPGTTRRGGAAASIAEVACEGRVSGAATSPRREPRSPAAGRPGPRLAHRHARRREGARGALRALSRRGRSSRFCTCRARCRRPIARTSDPRLVRAAAAARRALVPPLPAAVPGRGRAVRPRRLRSGHLQQPLRGEIGRGARPRPSPVLLPLADALRVGPVRRLFRSGAPRAGQPPGPRRRCARWPAGTPPRAADQTAMWRILNMLHAGSGATIIGRPSWCAPPVDTVFYTPAAAPARALPSRGLRPRPLQTPRRRHPRRPHGGAAAEDRRRRHRAGPTRGHGRTRCGVPGSSDR